MGADASTWSSAVLDVVQVPSGTVKQETKIKGRKQGWIIKLATEEPPRPGFIRLDNNVVECSYYVEEVGGGEGWAAPGVWQVGIRAVGREERRWWGLHSLQVSD